MAWPARRSSAPTGALGVAHVIDLGEQARRMASGEHGLRSLLRYQRAVFYEILVRGFYDGNGDGRPKAI